MIMFNIRIMYKRYYLSNNGFTLMELLIAIGMMAILMGMALPSFVSWRENMKYRQAASGLVALMREAKRSAISTNREQRIALNVANNSYQHQVGDRAANSTDTGWTPASQNISWISLPDGVGIQTAFNRLQFNPNGTMLYYNQGGVVLSNVNTQVFIQDTQLAANRYRIDLTQTGRIAGPVKLH